MLNDLEKQEINKKISLLLSYSADVIASYSLAKDYDPKTIAHAIDYLFGEYGYFTVHEAKKDG